MPVAYLVRHGHNEINAGGAVAAYGEAGLTALGHDQVLGLAASWKPRPAVTVASPFASAVQTAQLLQAGRIEFALDDRLREFSYLSPSFANGTTRSQRQDRAEKYWDSEDPSYADGDDSESFADLAARVGHFLDEQAEATTPVVAVTHGMVIALAQLLTREDPTGVRDLFRRFKYSLQTRGVVANCAVVELPAVGHQLGWTSD